MSNVRQRVLKRLTNFVAYRPQRAVVLPAVGAFVGLLVAGLGIFRASPEGVSVVPPGYVALVNREGILTSDFIAQTTAQTGKSFAETTQAERDKTLHDMIDEELLVQRALVLDLPETTTEIREAMTQAVNAQVDAGLLAQPPTDAQLKSFYDTHHADYSTMGSMTVHDLVLHIGGYQNIDQSVAQAQTDAAEAVYQLRAGASIGHVMEHFGFTDSGRVDNGEQLDFAAKLHLGDKLFEAASKMSSGEISDPLLDTDGVHVLVMDQRRAPRIADFDSARAKVYEAYKEVASRHAQEENLKILRSEAQILLAPRNAQ
jgi:hypothetical protein